MTSEIAVGQTIKGSASSYRLLKEVGGGAQASFKAEDVKSRQAVFLKVYSNEPKTTDPRFNVFFKQQTEIYERLKDLNTMTEILYEHFIVDGLFYCSAKEFVEGKNLEKLIEEDLAALDEIQLLGLASVFVGVLKAIHAVGVTHTDLKPPQLFVSPDSCALGWSLKIKDFDSAHVAGVAPYNVTGTQFYFSPEHLRHENPIKAPSDVFTSGIILTELLTGAVGCTYDVGEVDDGSKYAQLVMAHRVNQKPVDAIKKMYKDGEALAGLIHRMLCPTASQRPSVGEVHKGVLDAYKKQKGTASAKVTSPDPTVPGTVQLDCDGQALIAYADKVFGRDSFRVFGRDKYQYADKDQFTVRKGTDGWKIAGNAKAVTPTKVNGESISGKECPLKSGDQVQVGPITFTVRLK
jgi:serine/threonine protein kinase